MRKRIIGQSQKCDEQERCSQDVQDAEADSHGVKSITKTDKVSNYRIPANAAALSQASRRSAPSFGIPSLRVCGSSGIDIDAPDAGALSERMGFANSPRGAS